MKRISFREWFRAWDADRFDLTEQTAGDMHKGARPAAHRQPVSTRPVERLAESETRAFRRIFPVLAAVLGTVMVVFLLMTIVDLPPFGSADVPSNNEVVARYVRDGLKETGAVNVVAGVILDYRAFYTLGESHVLYAALTAVLILLLSLGDEPAPSDVGTVLIRSDGIVTITAQVISPIVILFGCYVILNGHLGPGGGFSGGAIIGAGLILHAIAFGSGRIGKLLNLRTLRTVCLAALCFYSLVKCYSFFCGANGLHTVFSPGTPGRILSAGLILPLNVAVGIVVACTMYGLYSLFQRGRI